MHLHVSRSLDNMSYNAGGARVQLTDMCMYRDTTFLSLVDLLLLQIP
jgi:hypothetical protein